MTATLTDLESPETRDVRRLAEELDIRTQAWIDGQYVDAASGETFSRVNPATGTEIAQVAACDVEDVDRAVAGAKAAFESGVWRYAAPKQRKKVLMRFAQLIEEHGDELALLETLDMGKPIRDSRKVDVPLAVQCISYYGEAVDKVYDEVAPTDPSAVVMVVREPLGVVGAVVPWNFPLMMASWKLGPALATGNSVVLKPAEQSPLTALRIAELAAEAGIPDGVLQVVPGFGETAGQAIGRHPNVDMVAFTGSTEVGKYFLRYAGESNMKRVALECGGKSPHVVLPDSDLDAAATGIAWGVFYNQGEVCNAGSRLLVHESVKDELLEKVVKVSERIRPGDPLDPKTRMGAIVDETQLGRVLGYIESGKEEGAGLHLGGNRVLEDTGGYFVEPTIFDAVSNDMTIAREEIFGPVLSTIGFSDEDDAIRIANDTIYGLSAAVWTSDVTKAHRYARALRAGVVWVNTFDAGDITAPFGGFKQSGFGRDKSIHALEKFTDLKTIWIQL
jgi:gamma-glutamyl-gamma-aminobutyraldehyde dehydrogenase/4-guanidinobutyraldehyde dehydrogenase/NAD-dependent aldehyde dehydrogenase